MLNDAASQSVSQPASQQQQPQPTMRGSNNNEYNNNSNNNNEASARRWFNWGKRIVNHLANVKLNRASFTVYVIYYSSCCYLLLSVSPPPPSHCQLRLHHRHSSPGPLNYLTDLICLGCSLFTIVSEPRIYVYCGLQLLRVSAISVFVCVDVHVSVSQAVAVSLAE